MPMDAVVEWLMAGDPAIRWQTMRDLLGAVPAAYEAERQRVAGEGWGARLLALQHSDGSWGPHPYAKWDGTFYTMLVLRDFGLADETPGARRAAMLLLEQGHRAVDGGLCFAESWKASETCISGMGLALLARFGDDDPRINALVEYLLREQMPDGGWNCQRRRGATHSSFHTTISVLEGLHQCRPRTEDARISQAVERGHEFLLAHRLFRSHRTGGVVKDEFTRFHFPPRWHYDVLRGLDHLRAAGAARDERMADAVGLLLKRRQADARWRRGPVPRGGPLRDRTAWRGEPVEYLASASGDPMVGGSLGKSQRDDLRVEHSRVARQQGDVKDDARCCDDFVGRVAAEIEKAKRTRDLKIDRPEGELADDASKPGVFRTDSNATVPSEVRDFPENDTRYGPEVVGKEFSFTGSEPILKGCDEDMSVKVDRCSGPAIHPRSRHRWRRDRRPR
jgi:hypothetical protein